MNVYDLDPAEQQAQSLRGLIRYLTQYIGPYHPFLRRLYRDKGIDLGAIRTRKDLLSLPLVHKDDLRANPSLFVLQPAVPGAPALPKGYDTGPLARGTIAKYAFQAAFNYPRDHSQDVRHPTLREKIQRRGRLEWLPIHDHASTGSTGDPTPMTFTHYDIHQMIGKMAPLIIQEKRSNPNFVPFDWSERWMSLMPAAPHVAFYSSVLGKLAAGTPCFETCGGLVIPTDRQVELFAKGGFGGAIAIPSYVTHWLRRAHSLQKEGRICPLSSLRRLLLGA